MEWTKINEGTEVSGDFTIVGHDDLDNPEAQVRLYHQGKLLSKKATFKAAKRIAEDYLKLNKLP